MINDELVEKLRKYFVLKEAIKENINPLKGIRLTLAKAELKKEIISSIDNSVLNFEQLYKILKVYEDRKGRNIQFQTYKLICEETDFEDTVSVGCILVRKVGIHFQKEARYIILDDFYKDMAVLSETCKQSVPFIKLKNSDVSLFLEQFKRYFKEDYERITNLLIAYLLYKYV